MLANLRNAQVWRKRELTYHGMDARYALRNNSRMQENRLKEIRKAAGRTQPDVAAVMGVSVAQVSRWEGGKDNIPSHRLAAIAEAYGISIGEIFGGSSGISEDEIAAILAEVQAQMPATLPHSEWPRYVASALKLRLDMLSSDRSKADTPGRQA